MAPLPTNADVVVLGADPAGATMAALLARRGHRVQVLEKSHFPRFHIGESLLPTGLDVLTELDIDLAAEGFLRKSGAAFVTADDVVAFNFEDALPGLRDHAFQVDRARFDALIVDRARRAGALVREGVKATDVAVSPDGVTVTTTDGEYTARYVVDATGQDRLLGRQGRTLDAYETFGRAAAFCHLDGLSDAAAEELEADGMIHHLLRRRRMDLGHPARQPPIERGRRHAEGEDRRRDAGAGAGREPPSRLLGRWHAAIGDTASPATSVTATPPPTRRATPASETPPASWIRSSRPAWPWRSRVRPWQPTSCRTL